MPAVEIIADAVYNSTFSDSDVDIERANILQEVEVSVATTAWKSLLKPFQYAVVSKHWCCIADFHICLVCRIVSRFFCQDMQIVSDIF